MSDEYRPDTPVWKSYVWHNEKCFFVSTIERSYETAVGTIRGKETIVWEYDWSTAKRGKMLHQAGSICDHKQICHSLIAEGLCPEAKRLLSNQR